MAGYLTEISHSLNGGTVTTASINLAANHTLDLDLVSTYGSSFPSITSDNKGVVLSTLIVGVKDESNLTKYQSYQIARDPHKMIVLYPAVASAAGSIHGRESIKSFLGVTTSTLKAYLFDPIVRNSNNSGFEAGGLDATQANNLFIPGVNCRIGLSLTYTKVGESTPKTMYTNMEVSGSEWTKVLAESARSVIGGGLPTTTFTTTNAARFEMEIFSSTTLGQNIAAVFSDYNLSNIKPSTSVTLAVFAYLGSAISGVTATAPATLVPTWSHKTSSGALAFSRTMNRGADANNVDIAASTIGQSNTETLPDENGIGWVGDYDPNAITDTTVRITATANVGV